MGAVFLALALGILMGVSFGDSLLVARQRDILEQMEERLDRLQERRREQELELERWEGARGLLRRSFRGALAGKEILLFSYGAGEAAAVRGLLEESGAAVTLLLAGASPAGEGPAEPPFFTGEGGAGAFFDRGAVGAGELEALGLRLEEGGGGPLEWPPDCCLLLPAPEELGGGGLLLRLWQELQGRGLRAIALFPWPPRQGGLPLAGLEPGSSLVDNIDTFWGQLALLIMLAEGAEGHYGFDGAGRGLWPEPAEVD